MITTSGNELYFEGKYIGTIDWTVPDTIVTVTITDKSEQLVPYKVIAAKLGLVLLQHLPDGFIAYDHVELRDSQLEIVAGKKNTFYVLCDKVTIAYGTVNAYGELSVKYMDSDTPIYGEILDVIKNAIDDQWIPDELSDLSYCLRKDLMPLYHGNVETLMRLQDKPIHTVRVDERAQQHICSYFLPGAGRINIYKPNDSLDWLPYGSQYVKVWSKNTDPVYMLWAHDHLFEMVEPLREFSSSFTQNEAIKLIFNNEHGARDISYLNGVMFDGNLVLATYNEEEQELDWTNDGQSLPVFRMFYKRALEKLKPQA